MKREKNRSIQCKEKSNKNNIKLKNIKSNTENFSIFNRVIRIDVKTNWLASFCPFLFLSLLAAFSLFYFTIEFDEILSDGFCPLFSCLLPPLLVLFRLQTALYRSELWIECGTLNKLNVGQNHQLKTVGFWTLKRRHAECRLLSSRWFLNKIFDSKNHYLLV